MIQQTTIDQYELKSPINESAYAVIFRAADTTASGAEKVVKIAKPAWETPAGTSSLQTQAFNLTSAGAWALEVPPNVVLEHQITQLTAMQSLLPSSIESHGVVPQADTAYYSMPFHDGLTLRELVEPSTPSLLNIYVPDVFKRLANLMDSLSESRVPPHGNLTPEHVMMTKGGLHLLSPGFFTPVSESQKGERTIVTTPAYYPFYEPDDKLAFGIMLFEALCKVHPFAGSDDKSLEKRFNKDFRSIIGLKMNASPGFSHLQGLLRFRTPRELKPDLPQSIEDVLIKLLRLGFNDKGEIVPGRGFENWRQIRAAIVSLD